jgi:hypothetical protein
MRTSVRISLASSATKIVAFGVSRGAVPWLPAEIDPPTRYDYSPYAALRQLAIW